jgi:transposase
MKKDSEVKRYMQARKTGKSQKLAAASAGMSERTGRKYERKGTLPSQLKQPRTWLTRKNPFEQDWDWVVAQLERDPALQATTLLALLIEQHPGRYRPSQIVTLRRHIARWRALSGPEREVIFEQVHTPGEHAQSDFTHMSDLGVIIGGEAFPHLIYHFVFTYSNVEAVALCFSESFEALAEGIEHALWQLGGVPQQHRTDHLTAAVRQTHRKETREEWTARYQALMAHYGMQPTWNNAGIAHENGDVEQAHHRFKEALDQALRVRGSREFASRAEYWHFVCDLVARRNRSRAARWHEEQAALRPLPRLPLIPCKEVQVRVSRFSTIHVGSNVYSVPSRLIGTKLLVRLHAQTVEGYVGTKLAFTLPRLVGTHQHRIDYHHFIWSLVRKPGAFAAYRYRDELFPTTTFRLAYDRLRQDEAARADGQYVRLLHLAASTSEAEVDTALQLLLEAKQTPTAEAVRELVKRPVVSSLPELSTPVLTLEAYDQLIPSRRDHA